MQNLAVRLKQPIELPGVSWKFSDQLMDLFKLANLLHRGSNCTLQGAKRNQESGAISKLKIDFIFPNVGA